MEISSNMTHKWKVFKLLMQKNFLVRKKHWFQSIVIQVMVPICLLLLGEATRYMFEIQPINIHKTTYHEIQTKSDILQEIEFSTASIRFTPQNSVTEKLMEDTRLCLGLKKKRKFSNCHQ